MSITHPQLILATIARDSATKKELATKLKGPDLESAWRIKQLQNQRSKLRSWVEDLPRTVNAWEVECGRPHGAMIWPFASNYRFSFERRIASQIQSRWAYGKYRWHEYRVSVSHSRSVGIRDQHAGSGCVDYPVHILFDLLRQEAVWIGGLLTIRAKSDRRKSSYPCWWFERRASDPKLHLRQGRIVRRNFHEEAGEAREQRLNVDRLKRAVATANKLPPAASWCRYNLTHGEEPNRLIKPWLESRGITVGDLATCAFHASLLQEITDSNKAREIKDAHHGWVTEADSIRRGNCAAGTRSFIEHRIIPWFSDHGFTVGDLTGCAVRKSLVLEIERNSYTARL